MRKLELKDLAPYLPYGLKVVNTANYKQTEMLNICELSSLVCNNSMYVRELGSKQTISHQSPIYRPLSDLKNLTTEYATEHSINQFLEKEYGLEYGVFSFYKGEIDFELDGDSDLRYDANKSISFKVMESVRTILLENHYDLNGLIDAGLAIDINTLEQ